MPSYRYSRRQMSDALCSERLGWTLGHTRRVARERAMEHPDRFREEEPVAFLARMTGMGRPLTFKRRNWKVRVELFFMDNGRPDYCIKAKQLQPDPLIVRARAVAS